MTTANMKMVTIEVELNEGEEEPKPQLDEGELGTALPARSCRLNFRRLGAGLCSSDALSLALCALADPPISQESTLRFASHPSRSSTLICRPTRSWATTLTLAFTRTVRCYISNLV
jgi:hypothetical protein